MNATELRLMLNEAKAIDGYANATPEDRRRANDLAERLQTAVDRQNLERDLNSLGTSLNSW